MMSKAGSRLEQDRGVVCKQQRRQIRRRQPTEEQSTIWPAWVQRLAHHSLLQQAGKFKRL